VHHLARSSISLVLLLRIGAVSGLSAQEPGKQAIQPSVPFELVSGFLLVIPGQIGNIEGLKFILDTGATRSVIDRKLADRLHVRRHKSETLSFDTTIPVEVGEIPEMRIGPLRGDSVSVLIVKLDEYSKLAEHVDGVIGLDMLSRSWSFTIDYERKMISFQIAEGGSAAHTSFTCFVTRLYIQGLPVSLLVDTGFDGILLYQNRLRARLPGMRVEGEFKDASMGRLRMKQVRLPDVRMLDSSAERTVYLMDEHTNNAVPGVDGFFGPGELRAKRIEFDFAEGRLRFQ
jgi:predicted aspartyl protease